MVRSFKDADGREWVLSVHVGVIRRIRQATDVDLPKLIDDGLKGLRELLRDPCKLCDVLFVMVKDQADKKGITDEQFGAALGGDALGEAADAFVEALVDFFPKARQAALRDVLAKARTVAELMAAQAREGLNAIDPGKLVEELLAKAKARAESGTSSAPAVGPAPSPLPPGTPSAAAAAPNAPSPSPA
jgi:hypothetical protein